MIICVAYGSENNGTFYVQTCCNEEHLGQDCDCKAISEGLTQEEAKSLAEQKAEELNVKVEYWY